MPPRRALLLGALALAGCGFAPAYGPGGAGGAFHGATAITAPDTADGYRLLARLQDRLGRTDAARFHLTVTLDIAETAAAVSSDGVIRRHTLTGTAGWRLTEIATGAPVAADTARAFAGYGTGGNTVAIRAATADAHERLARQLADMIVTRLLALTPGA